MLRIGDIHAFGVICKKASVFLKRVSVGFLPFHSSLFTFVHQRKRAGFLKRRTSLYGNGASAHNNHIKKSTPNGVLFVVLLCGRMGSFIKMFFLGEKNLLPEICDFGFARFDCLA